MDIVAGAPAPVCRDRKVMCIGVAKVAAKYRMDGIAVEELVASLFPSLAVRGGRKARESVHLIFGGSGTPFHTVPYGPMTTVAMLMEDLALLLFDHTKRFARYVLSNPNSKDSYEFLSGETLITDLKQPSPEKLAGPFELDLVVNEGDIDRIADRKHFERIVDSAPSGHPREEHIVTALCALKFTVTPLDGFVFNDLVDRYCSGAKGTKRIKQVLISLLDQSESREQRAIEDWEVERRCFKRLAGNLMDGNPNWRADYWEINRGRNSSKEAMFLFFAVANHLIQTNESEARAFLENVFSKEVFFKECEEESRPLLLENCYNFIRKLNYNQTGQEKFLCYLIEKGMQNMEMRPLSIYLYTLLDKYAATFEIKQRACDAYVKEMFKKENPLAEIEKIYASISRIFLEDGDIYSVQVLQQLFAQSVKRVC